MTTPGLWESWFAEHPDGGVKFLLDDDSASAMLRSNEEVHGFFSALGAEQPKTRVVVDMIRVRGEGPIQDKLYPPGKGGDA